ncbi:hypothetical protein [Citrobacter sp. wls826]|uniref:hypothetical protein n=1 Tax=Citrobacter sp. wls826 TaxID=2576415 RepID=UPI0010C9F7AD|nr:hypothetical protein [Citrobacter sp. wls826]TKU26094.1 hypothetical protein FDW87_00055 [Citrobacter sp. wls826]TKV30129.1 hypothetical protein FDX20_27325 [Citrobacter sp. TBCS-11]
MMRKVTQNAAMKRMNSRLVKRNQKVVKLKLKQRELFHKKFAIVNDGFMIFVSDYLTPWLVEEWLLDECEYIEGELNIKLKICSS